MSTEYQGDVRDLSYDDVNARPLGLTAEEIATEARVDDILSANGVRHVGKPNRYYLLRHLGLVEQAEALLNDTQRC